MSVRAARNEQDPLLYHGPGHRHSQPPNHAIERLTNDIDKIHVVSEKSNPASIAAEVKQHLPASSSASLSGDQLVALAETDIAIGKAQAVLNAVSLVKRDPQLPLFPGEDVVMDVRARELLMTLEETKETLDSAQEAILHAGPQSTKSKIAAKIFPSGSKHHKVDAKIDTAKCLADNLDEKAEALLTRIEGIARN